MDTPWRIELLGGLRILRGEQPVPKFRIRWSASLLAYLAYHQGRSFRKEALIERLWPELEPAVGGGRFRQALFYLRQRLEPLASSRDELVVASGSEVRLNPEVCCVDVAEFVQALAAAKGARHDGEKAPWLKQAVELYRGELLPGAHEPWIDPERLHLAEQYRSALDRWIAHFREGGDLLAAIDWTARVVRADPLHEESHERLIRLLAAAGQPEAALRDYRKLEQLLARESAAAPSPEITAFIRTLWGEGDDGRDALPAIERARRRPSTARAGAVAALAAGQVVLRRGDYPHAERLLRASLAQFRAIRAPGGMARALEALGCLAYQRHEGGQARAFFEEGRALCQAHGDPPGVARMLCRLADVAW